ncbi:MAG: RecX family transcriptional regulator [Candidatus Omnitrophica bacterium]|nr:RecX family transcriptional regulator [Candidatus Omnitrophota bacterium]
MSTQEQKKQAWLTSLRLLAASPKSRGQIMTKLEDKGYPEEVVRETLDMLERRNFLNDKKFAAELAQKFRVAKPSGRKKIAFELKAHGVPPEVCEEILSGWDDVEESQRAQGLACVKWAQTAKLPKAKRWKKVYDFLVRRGFEFQLARDVLDDLAGEQDD